MQHTRFTRITTALFVAAPTVMAEATPAQADTGSLAVATLDQAITNLQNWLVGFLVALATLFLTIGGIRYLAANGDPGAVEKAKSAFKSAAVGYALAAMAKPIVAALQSIVG